MERWGLAVIALAAVALSGCGDDSGTASSGRPPADVEQVLESDLPQTISENAPGDTFRGVQCIHRAGNAYDCVGDYRMGLASAKESMAGIDTSDFAAADWEAVRAQGSGNITFEVLMRRDGAYNWQAK